MWFVVIWVTWNTRNAVMFRGAKAVIGDMIEQVKLKSWLWITSKNSQFLYPLANWFTNPRSCLGLFSGSVVS